MTNHRKDTDPGPSPLKSEREESTGNYYSGTESFFGVFTQAQVYLNGVRLVHDGKVTQQVSDLASQIENNRRRFLHSGDVNFALQELMRITNAYNQRVQAWESQASQRERNKKTMSGGALAKMKAEFSMVRTKTRLASRTLTKLEVELHQIAGRESSELTRHGSGDESSQDNPARPTRPVSDLSTKPQVRSLSTEQQAKAAECLGEVKRFLERSVGTSLLVAYENANREVAGNPNRVEQVWDIPVDTGLPVFLAAGWTVKNPSNSDGLNLERKKLDLCFWLVPKSLSASQGLRLIEGQVEVWISSRKLEPTRISFELAAESEFPASDLVAGFLKKFEGRYGESPTLLAAHFQNLEWTQKNVVASCSEN